MSFVQTPLGVIPVVSLYGSAQLWTKAPDFNSRSHGENLHGQWSCTHCPNGATVQKRAARSTSTLLARGILCGRPLGKLSFGTYFPAGGSSCLSNQSVPSIQHSVVHVPARHCTDGYVAEQARGGERQVWPLPPRGPGTGGLRREQAPVPCAPAMASDHTLSRKLATTQQAGPHEDPLTASSGRPSDERVTGRGDQPKSPHVLCGASEGFILLVPTRFTEIHISSPVSSMCLWATDHLEGTKVAVFPSLCAPARRPVRQRSGLAVTEEWQPGRRWAT